MKTKKQKRECRQNVVAAILFAAIMAVNVWAIVNLEGWVELLDLPFWGSVPG